MPCTGARQYATTFSLAAAALLAWHFALLDKQSRQAGQGHSMDHLLLLLWAAARCFIAGPVGVLPSPLPSYRQPASERSSCGGEVDQQRPIHPCLKRRERSHPLFTDRDRPLSASVSPLLPPPASPPDSLALKSPVSSLHSIDRRRSPPLPGSGSTVPREMPPPAAFLPATIA
jgi:hypothetical protein